MNDNFLTKDALFHNRTETMTLEQQCRFDTMLLINHVINCALTDDRERSSGKCLDIQFTYFLNKLRQSFETTIDRCEVCKDILIFDDFIRIADFCFAATKEIVANPSTHIEKVDTKMLANKVNGFGTKTMRWMSQRPGRTIQEKISPDNKVLTSKTVFSPNTKENQEFMYLYRVLHEAVADRSKDSKCQYCNKHSECGYYDWVSKMQRLMAMNIKIKASELGSVKPIKQTFQNNKLMCDKNYKIIWDSVMMLSHLEEKIASDYNSNLKIRLATVVYWLILAKIIEAPDIVIEDSVGALIDTDGSISFGNEDESRTLCDDIIVKNSAGRIKTLLTIQLSDLTISIKDASKVIFELNIDEYFQMIDSMVEQELAKIDDWKMARELKKIESEDYVFNNDQGESEIKDELEFIETSIDLENTDYLKPIVDEDSNESILEISTQDKDNEVIETLGGSLEQKPEVVIVQASLPDSSILKPMATMPKFSEGTKVLAVRLSMKAEQMKMNPERMKASSSFITAMEDLMSNLRTEDPALLSSVEAKQDDLIGFIQLIKDTILAN